MRIAPVGLFFHRAPDLYEQVRTSAAVTHTHLVGIDGAAVLAWSIAQAVRLDPSQPFPLESFCRGLIDFARTLEVRDKLRQVRQLLEQNGSPGQAILQLGAGVAAHESVPFAIYAFLRHPQSFEDGLFGAILHGGDRDTLGAMTGAISGTYLGVGAMPQSWLEKLENRPYLEELALRLLNTLETHDFSLPDDE